MHRTTVLLSQLLVTSVFIFTSNRAFAELIPDNTLGAEASRIRQINSINDLNIEGGAQRGSNLFHSFSQFNINNGQSVYFNNPTGVQNILTRVTGGQISNILGTLGVNGSANLFLINPSGIVFGENARLDIGGSFIASSASNIKFLDGSEFNASLTQEKPLLTISVPVGLGMGSNPGEIKVLGPGSGIPYEYSKDQPRSQIDSSAVGFAVKPEKTLALLGGNVIINGGVVRSPAGRIEIGSVGSNAEVSLTPVTEGWKLGYEKTSNFADIQISEKAFVTAAGIGGGHISLRGRNINLNNESVLITDTKGNRNGAGISIVGESIALNKTDISNNTFDSGSAGKIELFADKSIQLENYAAVGSHTTGKGDAGEIIVSADSITFKKESGMGSNTYSETGRGGRFLIKANSFLLENRAGFAARSFSGGNASGIDIIAGKLELRNVAGINTTTESSGNSGQINITTNSLLLENNAGLNSNASKNSTGKAGEINIVTDSLVLRDNVGISSETFGTGEAGKINIRGNSLLIEQKAGINSNAKDGSTGQAGEINIVADSLILRNYSSIKSQAPNARDAGKIDITATSFIIKDNAEVRSDTSATSSGKAGIINVKSNSLLIEDSAGINNQSSGRGDAGVINLNIGDMIVRNRSGLSSNTNASGNGGQVNVTTNSLLIENYSGFNNGTLNNAGRGGDFNIHVKNSFVLRNVSGIRTDTFGLGEAGQINLTADYFEVSNLSGIRAITNSSGNAGNLRVQARNLIINNDSSFRVTSAGSGRAGTLNVVADNIQLNDGQIFATTTVSGNGGNLTLDVASLLQLSNKSQISTTAGTAGAGGDGGNITINAANAFIVGVPNGNSDITANAFNGRGGNVIINTAGVFGMEVRSRENLERLLGNSNSTQLNPKLLQTNDITAISQQNPSLSGLVTINTPYIKPNNDLANLPSVPVDTKISQGCYGANQSQSRFVNIGRSGLPPSPLDYIDGDIVDVDWVAIKPSEGKSSQENPPVLSASKVMANSTPEEIVEATGWVVNEKGIVMLVANLNSDGHSSWQNPNVNSCVK
ncbi:MAG: filamentous hemagglutinin N-terminal domain-containing protein [Scytonematopsis contorta HA4267-MV1]|jgi:filamentous hemagglutinin family protein|nr:filamentous hemagglutinin N-terminal domain-containing protein [Scytonematopsis contorta HA4267-MV1]